MSFHTLHHPPGSGEAGPVDLTVIAEELSAEEVRVLGAMMEKEVTTPDNYPLSLNALVTACNQKTSRDPVVEYDEATVRETLDRLRERGLTRMVTGGDNRVPKYRQMFSQALRLSGAQHALLCVLMLRGAQTLGELKDRSQRMHEFASLNDAEQSLATLMDLHGKALVMRMERIPGTKEPRYAHLLAGQPPAPALVRSEAPASVDKQDFADRIEQVEREIAELRAEVRRLSEEFERLTR